MEEFRIENLKISDIEDMSRIGLLSLANNLDMTISSLNGLSDEEICDVVVGEACNYANVLLQDRYEESVFRNKEDLLLEIRRKMATDNPLVRGYLEKFYTRIEQSQLPEPLTKGWHYKIEINRLYMAVYLVKHVIKGVWTETFTKPDSYDVKTEAEYKMINMPIKLIPVTEFARREKVSDIAVRQWIRRGQLTGIRKTGSGWAVSELATLTNEKHYGENTYYWEDEIQDLLPEYEYLKDGNMATIKAEKEGFAVIVYLQDRLNKEIKTVYTKTMNVSEKEKLEIYLLQKVNVEAEKNRIEQIDNKYIL